jgi:signal transduction histidine kinase/ActR/RegA family two-component response regulator
MTKGDVFVDGLRCAPGTPFFRWLVMRLRDGLGVRYAFIGEFTGDDASRLRVLATSDDTDDVELVRYDYEVRDTFAAEPPDGDGFLWHPSGLRQRFPHVRIFHTLGIESFAGLRLTDVHGRALGMLGVLHTAPFAAADRLRSTLLGLRARTGGDLELRRAQRERRLITETAVAARESNALPRLVEHLARALDVRIAFVAELLDRPAGHARTLAVWEHGRLGGDLTYSLAGTPCAQVYQRDVVLHARDLRRLFPDDPFVARTDAQAYMATALHDHAGRTIGHIGVLHDRPLDDGLARHPLFHVLALLAGKELERIRATRAIDTERELIAGGVAHDFNNLLAGIVAHSGLALDELTAPDAVRARLEAIQLTAQRAADLARGILDAERERLVEESVDLGALARETATLLGPAIPPHVSVEFDERPGLPPVRGNPTQLRQILMNLLLNGVEAVGERPGHVRIALDVAQERRGLVLMVSDTGIGMNEATEARIFEPSFTTKARGRGIGLPLVRELVERHRGSIAVASTPGAGSRFTVTFPAGGPRAERAPTAPAARVDPPTVARLRALLVDDDEGVRVTTGHMLRRLGCDVVTAADGHAAIAALELGADDLDLALLDMAMPGMSGEDLIMALRERWPTIPIVVMSGYTAQDLVRRLGQKGALRILQKPFGLDALRHCLHELSSATPRPSRREAISA